MYAQATNKATLPMIQNKNKLGDSVMKEKCINTAPVHAAKDPLLISTNQKQESYQQTPMNQGSKGEYW